MPSPQKLKPRGPAPWDNIDPTETLKTLKGISAAQPTLNLDNIYRMSVRNPILGSRENTAFSSLKSVSY